jgi:hypothetical protein
MESAHGIEDKFYPERMQYVFARGKQNDNYFNENPNYDNSVSILLNILPI